MSSLQYQRTGINWHYQKNDNDLIHSGYYSNDVRKKQTYHKICLPVSLGYKFRIKNACFSVFGGIRYNYFLTGRFYEKVFVDYSNKEDYQYENSYNPIKCGWPVDKFNMQLSGGISFYPSDKLIFSLSYHSGNSLTFSESKNTCTPESFVNDDFLLGIVFYPFSSK